MMYMVLTPYISHFGQEDRVVNLHLLRLAHAHRHLFPVRREVLPQLLRRVYVRRRGGPDQGGGCSECVRVHWCSISKQ